MAWTSSYGPPRSHNPSRSLDQTPPSLTPRYQSPTAKSAPKRRPVGDTALPMSLVSGPQGGAAEARRQSASYYPPGASYQSPPLPSPASNPQTPAPLLRKPSNLAEFKAEVPRRRPVSAMARSHQSSKSEPNASSEPTNVPSSLRPPQAPRICSASYVPQAAPLGAPFFSPEMPDTPGSTSTTSTLHARAQTRQQAVSDVSHDFGIKSNPWAETPISPILPSAALSAPKDCEATFAPRVTRVPTVLTFMPETPQTAIYERNLKLLDLYLEAPDSAHIAELLNNTLGISPSTEEPLSLSTSTTSSDPIETSETSSKLPVSESTPTRPSETADPTSLLSLRAALSTPPPYLARSSSNLPTYLSSQPSPTHESNHASSPRAFSTITSEPSSAVTPTFLAHYDRAWTPTASTAGHKYTQYEEGQGCTQLDPCSATSLYTPSASAAASAAAELDSVGFPSFARIVDPDRKFSPNEALRGRAERKVAEEDWNAEPEPEDKVPAPRPLLQKRSNSKCFSRTNSRLGRQKSRLADGTQNKPFEPRPLQVRHSTRRTKQVRPALKVDTSIGRPRARSEQPRLVSREELGGRQGLPSILGGAAQLGIGVEKEQDERRGAVDLGAVVGLGAPVVRQKAIRRSVRRREWGSGRWE
ncbi:MAG: hypothetical protein MMC23_000898 [Stictis urceolatum]|nr:hypothetical protein [Stictis urceolata]